MAAFCCRTEYPVTAGREHQYYHRHRTMSRRRYLTRRLRRNYRCHYHFPTRVSVRVRVLNKLVQLELTYRSPLLGRLHVKLTPACQPRDIVIILITWEPRVDLRKTNLDIIQIIMLLHIGRCDGAGIENPLLVAQLLGPPRDRGLTFALLLVQRSLDRHLVVQGLGVGSVLVCCLAALC